MTNQKSTAEAFFLGLFGGAIAGMLFSPRSGVENREQIKMKANEAMGQLDAKKQRAKEAMQTANLKAKVLKDELMAGADDVRSQVKETASDLKQSADEIKNTTRQRASSAITAIKD